MGRYQLSTFANSPLLRRQHDEHGKTHEATASSGSCLQAAGFPTASSAPDPSQTSQTLPQLQRLRSLKRIPPELIPLGVVILFAVFAAVFAMTRKLMTDKTLRLHKSSPKQH